MKLREWEQDYQYDNIYTVNATGNSTNNNQQQDNANTGVELNLAYENDSFTVSSKNTTEEPNEIDSSLLKIYFTA